MTCGSLSGRDIDKAEELAIELIDLPEGAIKVPAHSRIAIQCQLMNTVAVSYTHLDVYKRQVMVWLMLR